MEALRKAFISQSFGTVRGLDFAQKGLEPIYKEIDFDRVLADFDKMDCKEYREQFPIQPRAAKDSILVDYTAAMAGEFMDMGLHLSGNPECWYESHQTPKRTVNLKVEYGIYKGYTAKEAADWLSEIVNLYYSLVKKYNVSILIEFRTTRPKNGKDIVFEIPLVSTGEYLNEAKAQYLFSPLFYRLFMFCYYRENKASEGFAASRVSQDSYHKGPRKEDGFFIIPALYNKYFSNHAAPDFDKIFEDIQNLYI
jgi:hypothetical protein